MCLKLHLSSKLSPDAFLWHELTNDWTPLADNETFLRGCCAISLAGILLITERSQSGWAKLSDQPTTIDSEHTKLELDTGRSNLYAAHTGKFLFTELLQKPEHILVMNLKSMILGWNKAKHTVLSPETSLSSRNIWNNKPNKSHHLDILYWYSIHKFTNYLSWAGLETYLCYK